ncbi:DUF3293 domain-containing protein [Caballeronia sp. ATUFL_M2_KS44]|uniref:DUF3293 domain-containing protein n=1 Tax=Caballeronia sp. ATUFL_M2_KS44 TaxID=2921767 RepID=UPI002027754B|nr:DUF3293 domain-containing protein [Caballeronia sp. ATUFL_M2_KS44]
MNPLFPVHSIPVETLVAYRSAIYRIDDEPPIDMTIDVSNDAAASLLARHRVMSAVFVTAFNPFGRELEHDENATRQQALAAYVAQKGLRALPGAGMDPKGAWTAETSLLVLGAGEEIADEFMTAFEQNAVVMLDADGVPRLRFHPRYRHA